MTTLKEQSAVSRPCKTSVREPRYRYRAVTFAKCTKLILSCLHGFRIAACRGRFAQWASSKKRWKPHFADDELSLPSGFEAVALRDGQNAELGEVLDQAPELSEILRCRHCSLKLYRGVHRRILHEH